MSRFTNQSQNLQNISPLRVEVNSVSSNFWRIWLFQLRHDMLISTLSTLTNTV